jgi:hypothetical protein
MAMTLSGSNGITFNDASTQSTGKQACKAWINFQGGNGNTAGTINDSYNVSSITVNGTGDYTVNFTTAMSNANYSTFTSTRYATGGARFDRLSSVGANYAQTTSATRVISQSDISQSDAFNPYQFYVAIFGA